VESKSSKSFSRSVPGSKESGRITIKTESQEKTMADQSTLISKAFQTFLSDAPSQAQAWGKMTQELGAASALDAKTRALAYLAVLAALRLESGIPFHVKTAKEQGASRAEIISAILVGLPAAGNVVTQALPIALEAYDSL
jgi:alkylhydroperoxidase/carboxymuconolactone decarboxylase family protein YurZ